MGRVVAEQVGEGTFSVDERTGDVFWTERQGDYDLVWRCDEEGKPVQFFTRRYVAPAGTATEPRISARGSLPRPVNMTGRQ